MLLGGYKITEKDLPLSENWLKYYNSNLLTGQADFITCRFVGLVDFIPRDLTVFRFYNCNFSEESVLDLTRLSVACKFEFSYCTFCKGSVIRLKTWSNVVIKKCALPCDYNCFSGDVINELRFIRLNQNQEFTCLPRCKRLIIYDGWSLIEDWEIRPFTSLPRGGTRIVYRNFGKTHHADSQENVLGAMYRYPLFYSDAFFLEEHVRLLNSYPHRHIDSVIVLLISKNHIPADLWRLFYSYVVGGS